MFIKCIISIIKPSKAESYIRHTLSGRFVFQICRIMCCTCEMIEIHMVFRGYTYAEGGMNNIAEEGGF